jgi:hypothetical protein
VTGLAVVTVTRLAVVVVTGLAIVTVTRLAVVVVTGSAVVVVVGLATGNSPNTGVVVVVEICLESLLLQDPNKIIPDTRPTIILVLILIYFLSK